MHLFSDNPTKKTNSAGHNERKCDTAIEFFELGLTVMKEDDWAVPLMQFSFDELSQPHLFQNKKSIHSFHFSFLLSLIYSQHFIEKIWLPIGLDGSTGGVAGGRGRTEEIGEKAVVLGSDAFVDIEHSVSIFSEFAQKATPSDPDVGDITSGWMRRPFEKEIRSG